MYSLFCVGVSVIIDENRQMCMLHNVTARTIVVQGTARESERDGECCASEGQRFRGNPVLVTGNEESMSMKGF